MKLTTVFLMASMTIFWQNAVFAELRINEIQPAPAGNEEEWVELYNDGDDDLSLSSYQLVDDKNNQLLFVTDTVTAHGFAKATAHSVLNNTGDTLKLLLQGNIVTTVTYPDGIQTGMSYLFCDDRHEWLISSPSALEENTVACITSTLAPVTPSPIPPPQISDDQLRRLSISEFMPYPETTQQEWVELYNDSDAELNLTGYYLDDEEQGGSSPVQFSLHLPSHSYRVIYLTNSILNNASDTIRLLTPQKTSLVTQSYGISVKGKTWGRAEHNSFCLQEPSPGDSNNDCDLPTPSPITPSSQPTSTVANTPTPTTRTRGTITMTPTKAVQKPKILGAMITHVPQRIVDESHSISSRGVFPSPNSSRKAIDRDKLRGILIGIVVVIIILVASVVIRVRRDMLRQE